MAIFGDGNRTNHEIGHNGTALDVGVNYFYGLLMATSFPISFTLNPVMFYYNYKQKLSLVTALFMLLSLYDFIFSFRTLSTAINLLKPSLDPLYEVHPTTIQRLQGYLGYTIGYSSMFITMILCVVRYVKIRAPFWAMAHKRMIVYVVIVWVVMDFVYNNVVGGLSSFAYGDTFMSMMQRITNTEDAEDADTVLAITFKIPFFMKIGIAVIFSLLTVIHLQTESGQSLPEVKRKSVVMILLLNQGNVIWFCCCVIAAIVTKDYDQFDNRTDKLKWNYNFFYLKFFNVVMAQCLLAAYNPLVFCVRITGIRDMVKGFILTGKMMVIKDRALLSTDNITNYSTFKSQEDLNNM